MRHQLKELIEMHAVDALHIGLGQHDPQDKFTNGFTRRMFIAAGRAILNLFFSAPREILRRREAG